MNRPGFDGERAEHLGHQLPLIDHYRFVQPEQRDVGVGSHGGSECRSIQPNDRRSSPNRGRRLATRTGTDDQHCRQASQQFVQQRIDQAGQIRAFGDARTLAPRDPHPRSRTPFTRVLGQDLLAFWDTSYLARGTPSHPAAP